MLYAELSLVKPMQVIAYPVSPTRDHPNTSLDENWPGGVLGTRLYEKVEPVPPPNVLPHFNVVEDVPEWCPNEPGWGLFYLRQKWKVTLKSKDEIKSMVNERRKKFAYGTILYIHNGNCYRISTDPKSQAALALAAVDPSRPGCVKWLTKDGVFIWLNHKNVLDLVRRVRLHVQTCFDTQAHLNRCIDQADEQSLALINIDNCWPSNF